MHTGEFPALLCVAVSAGSSLHVLSGRRSFVYPGVDHDLGAAILLCLPDLVKLRGFFNPDPVRDQEARINLPLLNPLQQRLQVVVHMGLPHMHVNALAEGGAEVDLVEHAAVHARQRKRAAFANGLDGLPQHDGAVCLELERLLDPVIYPGGAGATGIYDGVKQTLKLETDRPIVLRQAIQSIRKGGTLSLPGVYGGVLDKVNFGAAFGKGIHMHMGQTHMHNYLQPLLQRIEQGQIDPSFLISHRIGIEETPELYKVWQAKQDGCTKIVIDPWVDKAASSTEHVQAAAR